MTLAPPNTRRMWTASAVMLACSWLSYMDRQVLAVLSPTILADTGLSAERYAEVVSAFSIAYMLANPLWGSLLDYIGLRAGMLAAVALWSAASAAHAGMSGFLGFAAVRAVLGFGEGATFPGGLRAAMDSLPANRQSRGIAIAYSGGSLGAILAPVLVTPVAARFGWRAAFVVTGALGVAWLVLWWATARPPFLPKHERKTAGIVWPNFAERRFWALVASYGLGAIPIGPILYLAPLYMNRVLGFAQQDLGQVLWIPPLGWEAGYFFWGWIADRYAGPRPLGIFMALSLMGLPLALLTQVKGSAAALAIFFWAMFVSGGYLVLSLRTAARAYPVEQTSLVAGVGAGAWSALVALVLPVVGRWFDQRNYELAFLVVSLLPVVGTGVWWLLVSPKPGSGTSAAAAR